MPYHRVLSQLRRQAGEEPPTAASTRQKQPAALTKQKKADPKPHGLPQDMLLYLSRALKEKFKNNPFPTGKKGDVQINFQLKNVLMNQPLSPKENPSGNSFIRV